MASAYLSRTPSSTGNRKLFTFSCWFKKYSTGVDAGIFNQYENDNNYFRIRFRSDDKLQLDDKDSGSTIFSLILSRQLRDTSGFYHLVVAYDSAQSTEADRVKIYINGVLETALDTSSYPSQNANAFMNLTGHTVQIARTRPSGPHYLNGLMTHVHLADGTAYAASTFGESDSNGVWIPKPSPSVTYGTNGFFLKMDNSGNMGLDSSGQSNNLTTSGTITQAKDTPSNVFCTWNLFTNENASATFSNGNNTVFFNNSNEKHILATLGMNSGKFYWESKLVSHSADSLAKVGIESSLHNNAGGYAVDSYGYRGEGGGSGDASSGRKVNNGTFTNWGSSYTAGDIIGCAVDLDNNKIYFSKNGTWQESGDPTSGSTGTGSAFNLIAPVSGFYHPSIGKEASATATWSMNFGNGYFGTTAVTSAGTNASGIGIFEYDVPTGYTALSTKGLDS
jgi:hypothetical protein